MVTEHDFIEEKTPRMEFKIMPDAFLFFQKIFSSFQQGIINYFVYFVRSAI
jgi:hypothetical protein